MGVCRHLCQERGAGYKELKKSGLRGASMSAPVYIEVGIYSGILDFATLCPYISNAISCECGGSHFPTVPHFPFSGRSKTRVCNYRNRGVGRSSEKSAVSIPDAAKSSLASIFQSTVRNTGRIAIGSGNGPSQKMLISRIRPTSTTIPKL